MTPQIGKKKSTATKGIFFKNGRFSTSEGGSMTISSLMSILLQTSRPSSGPPLTIDRTSTPDDELSNEP
eukprot:5381405-Amphidinium_carterae.1